jgi:hypothetical protein
MNRTTITKVFSTSLSLALGVSSIPVPAGAFGPVGPAAPAFVERLTPPAQFGYVASSYAPNGEDKPRLIVISDLHGHVEVQRHIMGMLGDLVPKLKAQNSEKVPVFLEGGWEANLEEPLRGFSDPQTRHFMGEYYLQKAELGGPQAYSEKIAGTNQVSMIGVEDKEEYLANKARFAQTYPARRQLLEALKAQEVALRVLTNSVTGRSFQKLEALRDDYYAGHVTSARYDKALVRLAQRFHIQDRHVEVLKQAATTDPNELDIAMAFVYSAVSKELAESRPLTSFLRQQLNGEGTIRENLARVDANLDLLKRLVGDQLTPSEVTLAVSRMADLVRIAELLLQDQPVSVNVRDVVHQSLDFYPLAFLRDETLVKNSLASLDKMSPQTTGILVAGGFHTDAIAEYLRQHQIAHIVINPAISRDLTSEEELNYVKRMCGDHVTAGELEKDLAWIQTGRRKAMDAISSGTTLTGTNQGQKTPGTEGTGDKFLGGIPAWVRNALKNGGDNLAKAIVAIGNIGLSSEDAATVMSPDSALSPEILSLAQAKIRAAAGQNGIEKFDLNASLPAKVLKLVNGKYVLADEKNPGKSNVWTDLANDAVAVAPAGTQFSKTLIVPAVGDRTALEKLGAEARLITDGNGEVGVLPIALSRFESVEALNESKPTPGSREEAQANRGIHVVAHEMMEHATKIGEQSTTITGLALGAKYAARNFGDVGASRYASAVAPQVEFSGESSISSLADKIGEVFSGDKNLQSAPVRKLAQDLAKQYGEENAALIAQELASLQGSAEMAVARAGYTAPLAKRLREKLAAMWATASAA